MIRRAEQETDSVYLRGKTDIATLLQAMQMPISSPVTKGKQVFKTN